MQMNVNDRFERLSAAFQGFKGIVSGKLKTPTVTSAGVRASIAVGGGILVMLVSTTVAMGISTPGQFRTALVAMLPFASIEPDLPPPASAEVIGYGEVVAARELSLSAQASGRVTEVLVSVGDTVREGTTILRIDDTEAKRIVRDAETDVARAELVLARADAPARAPAGASPAEAAAARFAALDRAYVKISDIFPSLRHIVSGLEGILFGGLFADPTSTSHLTVQADRANIENPAADSMKLRATERYEDAKRKHEVAIARLRSVPGNPDDVILERVLAEANDAVVALSDATKATSDLYAFLKSHLEERGLGTPAVFREYETVLSEYSSQLDDQTAIFLNMVEDVRSAREEIPESDSTDTAIERQEAELDLRQAQDALLDARARLELYDVKAPFDGVVASLEKKTSHDVSDGDTVATLIASDVLVIVSLGQEEVMRVKLGERALVSFDGSDLRIRGRVTEISSGEKGEDGTVRFVIVIALDTDDRVKPGMQVITRFLED